MPPYRFELKDHVFRIVIGNFIAIIAVGVFAALKMMPFWLIAIPTGIHVAIVFRTLREQARKNSPKDFNE